MRVKSLFIFIVLNIFTLLAVTIFYEYISIDDKLTQLKDTVNLSLDRAVYNSTASEELFSYDFATSGIAGLQLYSYGTAKGSDGTANQVANSLTVWDGKTNQFKAVNAYGLTMYNIGFPISLGNKGTSWQNTYTQAYNSTNETNINSFTSSQVFEYLYGDVTNAYARAFSWANTGSTKTIADTKEADKLKNEIKISSGVGLPSGFSGYISSDYYPAETDGDGGSGEAIKVRKDFFDYYTHIGSKVLTGNFVKHKDNDTGRFNLDFDAYPVLADMGLPIKDYNSKIWAKGVTDSSGNAMMTDNWCQVIKVGKKVTYGSTTGEITKRSFYYLTPNSLGVTYIPPDVLKETFIANLDTNCRLTLLDSSAIKAKKSFQNSNVKAVINSATGCIKDGDGNTTSVHVGGATATQQHIVKSDENIINDGKIEYDLNTVQMKIEYFLVDFWNPNNATVVQRCVGEVGATTYDTTNTLDFKLAKNVEAYQEGDTGYQYLQTYGTTSYFLNGKAVTLTKGYDENQGRKIVAKVSTRIKVHIPYDNPIMQWAVYLYTGHKTSSEHYDIKLFNDYLNAQTFRDGAVAQEDGVWYQTSTYFAVTD